MNMIRNFWVVIHDFLCAIDILFQGFLMVYI